MATVAAAVGAGAVEPALEGPGVGRRRADALGGGPVATGAGGRRRRPGPAPPLRLGRRRRAGRRRAAAVVAVEPARLLRRVHVVGSH